MTDCSNKERQLWIKTLSSHRVTVTDDVSKLGYNSAMLGNLGAKDETYYMYCDLRLS